MAQALLLAGALTATLLLLGTALARSARPARAEPPSLRGAIPWVLAAELAAGAGFVVARGVPVAVTLGVLAYTGLATVALWRLARLDRGSPWMLPAERRARLAFSAVAVAWLGIILGLLLWIGDMVAAAGAPG